MSAVFAALILLPVQDSDAMLADFQKELGAGKPVDAVRILSKMITKFPDSASTVQAQTRFSARVDAPGELLGVDEELLVVRGYRQRWLGLAPAVYDTLFKDRKLPDPAGRFDQKSLTELGQDVAAMTLYLERGVVLRELGKSGQKVEFDNASTVFFNVSRATAPRSELWWIAKYEILVTLVDRAGPTDVKLASVGLQNIERDSPDFDEAKFGMRNRFIQLKKKIQERLNSK